MWKKCLTVCVFSVSLLTLLFSCGENWPSNSTTSETCSANERAETTILSTTKEVETITIPLEVSLYSDIAIDRKDCSIKSNSGDVLGLAYFDLLKLKDSTAAADKINLYLRNKFETWKDGFEMKALHENLETMREVYGDEGVARMPLQNTVNCFVSYADAAVVSLFFYNYGMVGGSSGSSCYGLTFSRKTGELLPITHFTKVKADELKEGISLFLIPHYTSSVFYIGERDKEVSVAFQPNGSFEYLYNGVKYKLFEDYYYDGINICLLINAFTSYGLILKWNGNTGDKFVASLWSCKGEGDVLIEYRIDP